MDLLERWAGYLAIAGGALTAVLVGVVAYDPNTSAWSAFFLVILLLGAAVPGMERRTRTATGRLGRVSAWLSTAGALGLLAVFVYAAATGQMSFEEGAGGLAPLWAVTAVAWFLGNIGFGLAVARAGVPSRIGGWLVVIGAVAGAGLGVIPNAMPPQALTLVFGLFGIGWIVTGYAVVRGPSRSG